MTPIDRSLSALIGARICHDLISPVGAIANGIELMGLAGVRDLPEMTLVADSAAHANARLRFFRIAFGLASNDQSMSSTEICSILDGVYNAKVTCNWQVDGPLPRKLAQAVFLALLCAEQAVPFGGVLTVHGDATRLSLSAAGKRVAPVPAHWAMLNALEQADLSTLPAAQVQFALLPVLLEELERSAVINLQESVSLSF